MYEEKSTEQIAAQVGLSENATRQLIFRARAAFKKALIGDVDTTGMSAAAILSVAARKAASEGKKVGAAALTLIALVVMSLTVFPGLNRAPTDQMAGPNDSSSSVESDSVAVSPTPSSETSDEASDQSVATESDTEMQDAADASAASTNNTSTVSGGANSVASGISKTPSPAVTVVNEAVARIFDSRASKSRMLIVDEVHRATSSQGVTAEFIFNPTRDEPFREVSGSLLIDDVLFSVFPDQSEWLEAIDVNGQEHFVYFGSMKYVFDENGKVWSDSKLSQGTLRIEVVMNENGTQVEDIFVAILSKG
jgi:RNA polymerase sigma-70 factor (ECF subfamily)